ncbi:hypothetical protein RFI_36855, partial [Reticulomyxa filosa]
MQRLIRRAFFYLEFPSSLIPSFELKVDLVPTEIQDLMVERLKLVLKKNIPINYFINKIKQEAEQTMKRQNESQPSFFQTYQITVDNLITLGWIRVLLSLYENCYLQAILSAIKNKINSRQLLINIFVASGKNEALVPLFDEGEITDQELHVWKVKILYRACFPFSWNFHVWCLGKLQDIVKKSKDDTVDTELISINAEVSKTYSTLKSKLNVDGDNVFLLLNQCNPEDCGCYAKDVIRGKFHAYFSIEDSDQIAEILKDIVLCIVQIVIGKNNSVSIPSIETILYYFENIITKYVQLVFLFKDEAAVISKIKETLSNCELTMSLEQLTMVTSIMCEYFLTHEPPKNELDNFASKMTIACQATITILKFLRQQKYTEFKVYQDFLS